MAEHAFDANAPYIKGVMNIMELPIGPAAVLKEHTRALEDALENALASTFLCMRLV